MRKYVTILLVEDDLTHRLLIRRVLEENGVNNKIEEVDDGQEALDYIFGVGQYSDRAKYPIPDLVLLDIKMPKVDGFEVLEKLKSDESTKQIPVVMLTTSAREEEVSRGYRAGANAYVTKPVDFQEFMSKLKAMKLFWTITTETPK